MLISTAGVSFLVLAIIEGPQWGWGATSTLACFAAAAVLLAIFTIVELRTAKPLLDVRVFAIPRFSGGAVAIAVAFFCLFGFIFLVTQYFQFVKGYSTLSAGVHTLPFAVVAAIFTPIGATVALKVGTRIVVALGLLLMAGGLVMAGFLTPHAAFFGPIIISMVLLSLGLSSITAPATEAVMGSLAADQVGAGAAVNNTTRELGGTLGVAVLGSVFASAYAPRITKAFHPYPIPIGAKQAASQSMAAALEVIGRAPLAQARSVLQSSAFSAFGAGFKVACIVGAGVAVIGSAVVFRLLPSRQGVPDRTSETSEPDSVSEPLAV